MTPEQIVALFDSVGKAGGAPEQVTISVGPTTIQSGSSEQVGSSSGSGGQSGQVGRGNSGIPDNK